MSVTPTLAAMFADPLLQYRYVRHLDNLIALAGKELERTRWQPEFHPSPRCTTIASRAAARSSSISTATI